MSIPVHIVAGFLGVGKTTALTRLVASRAGSERAAVIVNDFGEAAIDANRIGGETVGRLRVENIAGGCVCCTAPEGLVRLVHELLDVEKPDRIYIEPSGLGRPRDVVDMLGRGGIASRVDLRPVVVVVDPERLDLADPLMHEQWEGGDVLVVNRIDLASPEALAAVRSAVSVKWPPFLRVVETSHGVLPLDLPDWQCASPDSSLLDHGHTHDHGPSTAGFVARSLVAPASARYSWDALRRALTAPEIQRFKGMFSTDLGWLCVDVAGGRIDMRGTPWRRDNRADLIVRVGAEGVADAVMAAIHQAEAAQVGPGEPTVTLVDADGNGADLTRDGLARLGAIDVSARVPGRQGTAALLADVLGLLSARNDARVVLCAGDGLVADAVPAALIGDALLVYALAGEPLPAAQGGPFRVLVPAGVSKCANVKGLVRIRII